MPQSTGRKISALALVVMAGGCNLFGPTGPLEQTADRLEDIRSGNMTLELKATTAAGTQTGFLLEGPFALPSGDSLPAAELSYRQFGAPQEKPLTFISTGSSAYIKVGDQAYELPPDRVKRLRGEDGAGEAGPFGRLRIVDWMKEPKVSGGPPKDGKPTQLVRGELRVATALNNIFDVARALGRPDLPMLEGEDADRLNRAVESASMELQTGSRDRLMRDLSLRVNLAAAAPGELGPEIEKLLGVRFELRLALADLNKPVKVHAPADPLPLSRLE